MDFKKLQERAVFQWFEALFYWGLLNILLHFVVYSSLLGNLRLGHGQSAVCN